MLKLACSIEVLLQNLDGCQFLVVLICIGKVIGCEGHRLIRAPGGSHSPCLDITDNLLYILIGSSKALSDMYIIQLDLI